MSFKFNFSNPDKPENADVQTNKDNLNPEKGVVSCNRPAFEIFPAIGEKKYDNLKTIQQQFTGGFSLKVLDPNVIEDKVKTQSPEEPTDLSKALKQQSDLVEGVYEGGLTIWECGVDLVNYLISNQVDFNGKNVLELGCGAGLPGIYSVVNGARAVHFQDYNSEVLTEFTIPNIELNIKERLCECRYIAGDWKTLPIILNNIKYDYILTAETIYNPQHYNQLVTAFNSLLHQHGQILIAAKSYYFGVGGGTRLFESFVKENGVFTSEVVHVIEAGVPREIIRLKRKQVHKLF